jgi:hypothetical protein
MTSESFSHSLPAVNLIPAEQCHGIAIILSVFANLHSGEAQICILERTFHKK